MKNKRPILSRRITESITTREKYFPTIPDCWVDNENNKKIFLKRLKCEKLGRYHTIPGRYGCAVFDEAIVNFSLKYKLPGMFLTQFYSVITPMDNTKPRYWLNRVVGTLGSPQKKINDMREVSTYTIQKIPELRLIDGGKFVPRNYRVIPLGFELEQLFNDNTSRSRRIPVSDNTLLTMVHSIKKCIEDRIHFQKTCILQCSTKIEDSKNVFGQNVHDVIIEILNVLYCKVFMEITFRSAES